MTKKIYCVWLGKPNEKLADTIAQWKEVNPDFEIIVLGMDELGQMIEDHPEYFIWVSEALAAKEYAFISDLMRVYFTDKTGGWYLDTDVECVNHLLNTAEVDTPIMGWQDRDRTMVETGVFYVPKGWFSENTQILEYYVNRHFKLLNGWYDKRPNTYIWRELLTFSQLKDLHDYTLLTCKDIHTGRIGEPMFTIHHFAGSWLSKRSRRTIKFDQELQNNGLDSPLVKAFITELFSAISIIDERGLEAYQEEVKNGRMSISDKLKSYFE